ncbi:hypothetical protein CSAL01_07164 [Colletotrichum salicis]|uniref:Major facilitator superfamily (MFS) profile domain-containing protein n=1 Tax=Colletotrichum salicis TaxID=1209931 RepID=A0A135V9S1_9PEZI|nr:hypothetical protein CSAL01_07164 [Colletotrichum salicis]
MDSIEKKTSRDEAPETNDGNQESASPEYVEGLPLVCIIIGLTLAVFCLSLDRTILATAVPKITTEFNSLNDVAWYGSSYLLTTCFFQLMFGKLYAEFRVTWVFLAALAFFELGTIVCAAAPNSVALIIGRAISGIGCAGLLSGTFIIIAHSFPVHKRPIYTGMIRSMAGVAEIIAPTLGASCRRGAQVAQVHRRTPQQYGPYWHCPADAHHGLPTTGSLMGWYNVRVEQLAHHPLPVPIWCPLPRVAGHPVLSGRRRGMVFMLGVNGAVFVIVYYVSIWFQVVKDTTAEQSGINFSTSSTAVSVSSILSGVLTTKFGYWVPQMIFSTIVTSISSGLIFRYEVETTTAYWAGTLLMFGFGAGMGMQMPLAAIQTVLKGADVSLGTSSLILSQTLAGSIFLSVAQSLFQSRLLVELAAQAPQVDA